MCFFRSNRRLWCFFLWTAGNWRNHPKLSRCVHVTVCDRSWSNFNSMSRLYWRIRMHFAKMQWKRWNMEKGGRRTLIHHRLGPDESQSEEVHTKCANMYGKYAIVHRWHSSSVDPFVHAFICRLKRKCHLGGCFTDIDSLFANIWSVNPLAALIFTNRTNYWFNKNRNVWGLEYRFVSSRKALYYTMCIEYSYVQCSEFYTNVCIEWR